MRHAANCCLHKTSAQCVFTQCGVVFVCMRELFTEALCMHDMVARHSVSTEVSRGICQLIWILGAR